MKNNHFLKRHFQHGSISIFVLILGVVAPIVLAAVVLVATGQLDLTYRKVAFEQALSVAEAGIHYYRWHLREDETDLTDGTGEAGPYTHTLTSNNGEEIGTYELRVEETSEEGTITVTSTGWTASHPMIKRTIEVKFANPNLTKYTFLHNSNIWFGEGMEVGGPVYSNGGIRQDGVNYSTLKSSRASYTCGTETGCSKPEEKPGVWGMGGPTDLWEYPVNMVDFASINVDFNYLKQISEDQGVYLGPSDYQGYHLVFKSEGTFDVYEVTQADFYKGWSFDSACENLYQVIDSEQLIGTYPVSDNSVVFAEDHVWVEGVVNGRVTVVAARFPIDSYQKDIWIPDNLVYADRSGEHALGLIAQRDIAFGKDVPSSFEVNGALLAQSSRVLRHHYNYKDCKDKNPATKNELTIYGSVISNLIAYWNFGGGGGGNPTSGFVKRNLIYDPFLALDPPPFFPNSGSLEMTSWREVDNP